MTILTHIAAFWGGAIFGFIMTALLTAGKGDDR